MVLPDRISELMNLLEAGPISQAEVNRLAILQALDVAKLGEDFAREAIQREKDATAEMKKISEAAWPA